jgi:tripartite-type tricarboxylate transporter receptor subunit TctC
MKILAMGFSLVFICLSNLHAQAPLRRQDHQGCRGLPAGDAYDLYARMLAAHMGKYIPGNPNIIVQNMPGASSMITANHVYSIGKPDGLTFGSILPSLYFDQLLRRKEVQLTAEVHLARN